MTTIATDGKVMAADGLCTGDGLIHAFDTQKLWRLTDGRVVGIAGCAYAVAAFIPWLESGGDKPELPTDFEALVLSEDGKCQSYNEKCLCIPQPVPAVTGSGGALAMGAMLAGASAVQAVQIAAERDMRSGGVIMSMTPGKAEIELRSAA